MSDALGFLPDTKPDVAEPWRKVLLDAADYIDKHGWCPEGTGNGNGRGDNGEVCPVIAMVEVSGRGLGQVARWLAYDKFEEITGGELISLNRDATSAAEVTAALRACARQ